MKAQTVVVAELEDADVDGSFESRRMDAGPVWESRAPPKEGREEESV
jgi:hypothetical protein